MSVTTYTNPTRPGVWTKQDEWESRTGRCIDCHDSVTITHATFVCEETGESVSDRERLCSCNASYSYDFKPVKEETDAV